MIDYALSVKIPRFVSAYVPSLVPGALEPGSEMRQARSWFG